MLRRSEFIVPEECDVQLLLCTEWEDGPISVTIGNLHPGMQRSVRPVCPVMENTGHSSAAGAATEP